MAARVETRGRRPKILEPPKEPARSRTHWDHVLEEMVWLAKDFESERKWKLAHAKRVALRVSKSGLDQVSRGEKRLKEEEQRTRRLASNISKDVRKFWMKIEKLVLYKHQLETEERKKRALDKQLDFLLGQTERYSTMLAENLVDLPSSHERKSQLLLQSSPIKPGIEVSDHQYKHDRLSSKDPSGPSGSPSQIHISDEEAHSKILDRGSHLDNEESEDEFSLGGADDMEDDEATLEADEALITEDERREELAALKNESDLPIEELLKRYRHNNGSKSGENDSECNSEANGQDFEENVAVSEEEKSEHMNFGVESIEADTNRDTDFKRTATSDSQVTKLDTYDEQHENEGLGNGVMFGKQNVDFIDAVGNESRTISDHSIDVVEEKDGNHFVSLLVDLTEASNIHSVSGDGNRLSTTFVHDTDGGKKGDPLDKAELNDGILSCEQRRAGEETATSSDSGNETDDGEYTNAALTGEEEDDEVTLLEEEELARAEGNDTTEEVEFLKAESELPIEELLARYKQIKCLDEENADEPEDTDGTSEAGKNISSAIPDEKLEDDAQRMGTNLDYDGSITEEKDSDAVLKAKISPPETNELQKTTEEEKTSEVRIADAAAAARLAQPTGNTFSTTKVRTKLPFLLKHSLREYQHIGLDWLVTMYEKRLNGILADEMGLGKTIMTIALLAHLACEKGIWGPHLIVVPTSVMLNWETEFMKWCPAFKVLTYFGSAKERKIKRQGWAKPNSFHVCITTYRLVIQDAKAFKRKKWKYLILDEAHLIKNWKSQRWQTLLNFNSKRRILLTGTPLQNDLMELWSLMHFLMPHLFQSQQEFKDWFCNPISGMVERQEQVNKEVVDRLHNVLRPFILRRLKQDVEKQLPKKYEHVICCKLSKRQRNLYEDFIANSETQATLASGNFLGLINVLMQLRKVCNHPDLFEGRPIVSSFDMLGLEQQVCSDICSIFKGVTYSAIDLVGMNLVFSQLEFMMNSWEYDHVSKIATPSSLIQEIGNLRDEELAHTGHRQQPKHRRNIFEEIQHALHEERLKQARGRAAAIAWLNTLRCKRKPVYGMDLKRILTIEHPVFDLHKKRNNPSWYLESSSRLADLVLLPSQRCQKLLDLIESFVFAIPAARAPPPIFWCSKSGSSVLSRPTLEDNTVKEFSVLLEPLRPVIVRRQLFFPDRRLIQFDCGKLQELAILLRRLRSEGHRALIFTQMTRMLDVLEAFINLYGYTYVRLDGSTQPEERQILMQRFNTNPKIFLFILSTRSGGVGINLVGADTVIFYDSDWNPAMDQQAQDRCHRIGQTREVHIYRLVSERTIEENIIKKANQKRALDDLVIQSGSYNTEFFKKLDPMELFSGLQGVKADKETINGSDLVNHETQHQLSNADVEAALKNAEDEADYMALKKVELEDAADDQEFTEEVVGRLLEDDEYANDMEEARADVKKAQDEPEHSDLKNIQATHVTEIEHTNSINTALVPAVDSEVDVIPDVQQMAVAAAAAGHASTSLEDHLMPVERYAMRFLDLWDPIIDKAAIESQVRFEEEEWELDRLEKLKEELEAEIDEDNEPLLYESWDTEFANETYRQQVEVLAQQQLLQDQLEWDSEKEAGLDADGFEAKKSLKLKKKLKKTKFKSLKKRNLDSRKADNGEGLANNKLSFEYENSSDSDELPAGTFSKQKRKALRLFEDEILQKRHSKKLKRQHANLDLSLDRNKQLDQFMDVDVDSDDLEAALNEFASPGSKGNGKILITGIPSKKVSIIKLDKKKKKGTRKSRDHLPCPGPWSTSEDAILCAMVYEYGINWELASDTLYGITSGGFYRGRYRHPVHCRERFGELFLSHISSTATDPNSEKTNSSAKTLLKVTEEHVRKLLDVVQELPDTDWLLQRHFAAVLSAVFRFRNAFDHTRTRNAFPSNSLSVYSGGLSVPVLSHPFQPPNSLSVYSGGLSAPVLSHPFHTLNVDQGIINVDNANRNFELVAAALAESSKEMADKPCGAASISDQGTFGQKVTREEERATVPVEQLILSLEFPQIPGELDEPPYPKYTTIIVHGADIHPAPPDTSSNFVREPVCSLTGTCMRSVCETVLEGERAAFLSSGTMDISGTKPQGLGKHQPATDLTLPPKPKQPRLLDLNEGLLETDVGMQDLTGPDGNVEGTETTMPVDSSCLNSDLRAHLASISENLVSINLNESDEDIFRLGNIFEASFEQLYDTEIISHQYEPDFTANCCDLGNLSGSAFDALFV